MTARSFESLIIRVPPDRLWARVGWVMFVGSMGFILMVMALLNEDGSLADPELSAACIGGFWSIIFLIFLAWMLRTAVHQVILDAVGLRYVGLFKTTDLCWDAVESAQWTKTRSGEGEVLLKGGGKQIKVSFDQYDPNDSLAFIPILQAYIPANAQSGWTQFLSTGLPKPVDWKKREEDGWRLTWLVLRYWGMAIPVMYAILIFEKVVLDPQVFGRFKKNWFEVFLFPLVAVLPHLSMMISSAISARLRIKKQSL